MRNYPEWVVGYWAVAALGAAVGRDERLVDDAGRWSTASADSRPKVLIADDERLERVLPVLDGLRDVAPLHVIGVRSDRELPGDAIRAGPTSSIRRRRRRSCQPADIDPDDDVTIFYTSGTTGFPKGAQLTHRGSVHEHPRHRVLRRW